MPSGIPSSEVSAVVLAAFERAPGPLTQEETQALHLTPETIRQREHEQTAALERQIQAERQALEARRAEREQAPERQQAQEREPNTPARPGHHPRFRTGADIQTPVGRRPARGRPVSPRGATTPAPERAPERSAANDNTPQREQTDIQEQNERQRLRRL
jgi:hypothetical protein